MANERDTEEDAFVVQHDALSALLEARGLCDDPGSVKNA